MPDEVILYHNPKCSSSRNALKILKDRGVPHRIVKYLETPLDEEALRKLLKQLPTPPHDLLRPRETPYKEAGLSKASSEEDIVAAIAAHPILMQRPVVVRGKEALIARPPAVLEEWL